MLKNVLPEGFIHQCLKTAFAKNKSRVVVIRDSLLRGTEGSLCCQVYSEGSLFSLWPSLGRALVVFLVILVTSYF